MRWQAEATKRKHQVSNDSPRAKRRNKISSFLAKKASDKETQRTFKGSTHKTFPPKKYLDSIGNGRQEEKPCIKTSSLFKNNPEIPELHRCVFQCRCASGVSSHGHLVLHCCLGTDAHFVFPLQHCSEAGSRASVLSRSFPGAGPPPTSSKYPTLLCRVRVCVYEHMFSLFLFLASWVTSLDGSLPNSSIESRLGLLGLKQTSNFWISVMLLWWQMSL